MTPYSRTLLISALGILLVGIAGISTYAAFDNDERPPHDAPCFIFWCGSGSWLEEPVAQEVERRTLDAFPKATETWRTRFLAEGETVPNGKFQPYYFDTTNPDVRVKAPLAESVGMNIGWGIDAKTGKETDLINRAGVISSENLGAYWIGRFELPEDADLDLALSLSWAEARVIIDGHEVFKEGNADTSVPLRLTGGTHTMEVEYVNNWHTATFSANLLEGARAVVSDEQLKRELPVSGVTQYWYAGVYESDAVDGTITLTAPGASVAPTILFLSSYETVQWDASALDPLDIRAIVVSSHGPGARVFNAEAGTPIYYAGLPYVYETKGRCTYVGGTSHCENLYDFTGLYDRVRSVTGGKTLTGFSGSYGATSLALPGLALTDAVVDELLSYPAQKEREGEDYQRSNTVDGIFD